MCMTHVTTPQMQQLQDLGYSAFSFGFFEEDVHFVSTLDVSACTHHKVLQFLISLITASECLSLNHKA